MPFYKPLQRPYTETMQKHFEYSSNLYVYIFSTNMKPL